MNSHWNWCADKRTHQSEAAVKPDLKVYGTVGIVGNQYDFKVHKIIDIEIDNFPAVQTEFVSW